MNWTEIATACEKATGPDDQLDWAILMALCGKSYGDTWLAAPAAQYALSNDQRYWAPEWTGRLDAITALIERELPEYYPQVELRKMVNDQCRATFFIRNQDKDAFEQFIEWDFAESATPALALCAAFARAMHDKETDNGNV